MDVEYRAYISRRVVIPFTLKDLLPDFQKPVIRERVIPWLSYSGHYPDVFVGLADTLNRKVYTEDIVTTSWGTGRVIFEQGSFNILLPKLTDLPDGTCRNYIDFKDVKGIMTILGNMHFDAYLITGLRPKEK